MSRAAEGAFEVIVLGAGISGLVSASVLLDQGHRRVLVVDEYDHVGGNHIDHAFGPYTFDIGSLIFQDDSPLLRHFPELLPHYVAIRPSWERLNPQGRVTAYPFSVRDDLLAAGVVEWFRIAASLTVARLRRRPLRNARDFARYWLGARLLYRSGLESYMERMFGRPAAEIDLELAEKRMLWVAGQASLGNLARQLIGLVRPRPTTRPTNRQLARPPGGFGQLYRPAVQRLENEGVTFRLGSQLEGLRRADGGFELVVDGVTLAANRLVSTIPLDRTLELIGSPAPVSLPTVTLVSLFYSFVGRRGFRASVLYNFSHRGAWKRLTVHSDFYGVAESREYFTVEVIGDRVGCSSEQADQDFRAHTAQNGLLAGDLRLEGSSVLPHAYPIYTDGAGERAARAVATLKELGIESLGRQGAFQYQPTARVSTLEVETGLTQVSRATPVATPSRSV